jgi:hypothetical protein
MHFAFAGSPKMHALPASVGLTVTRACLAASTRPRGTTSSQPPRPADGIRCALAAPCLPPATEQHTRTGPSTGALDVTVDNLRPQTESICYGAITATRAVQSAIVHGHAGRRRRNTAVHHWGLLGHTRAGVRQCQDGGRSPTQMGPHPQRCTGGQGCLRRPCRDRQHGSSARQAPPKAPHSRKPTTSHASTGISTLAARPPNT